MAIPFLSSSIAKMVADRVLANVLEQLPKALAGRSGGDGGAQAAAASALAIQSVAREMEGLREELDSVGSRLSRLEARVKWRMFGWIVITALAVYGIGFGTALALRYFELI